ncbi:MAG: hypothetical protein LBQ94_02760 [Treponema sp.]|jgi:hypothetical protein|nr:hypothetical protein [Treponema sp.]
MKKIYFAFSVMLLIGTVAIVQADEELPEWVTRAEEAWVEEGVIYARGAARMSTIAMSSSTANSRARTNLSRALANGEITGYAAVPADTKTRTTFIYNGKSVVVGDLTVKDTFADGDGYVYVLLSCTGAEKPSIMNNAQRTNR